MEKSNKKQGGQKWIQGKTKVEEEGKKKKKNGSSVSERECSALKIWPAKHPRWEESFVTFLQGNLGKTWKLEEIRRTKWACLHLILN